MADPRLQWRQLNQAQPNVSGLLAQVRGGINDAAGAAEGILGRYQEGQELAAENELARRIGGRTQEELTAMFNEGAFDDLNLGENGLRTLNTAISGRADVDNTNSIVRNRDGRLVIAQGQEADANRLRDQAYSDDQALRAAAGDIREAQRFRAEYGDVVGPITQTGGDPFENYIASTIQSESGGDPNARNPNSTATGLAQFTEGTWADMMRNHPELNLTVDGRTDPAQAERALRAFTRDNMAALEGAGIPITEGNLYAAHFLGAGGARSVLSQPDNARVADIVGADVVAANPFLANMSVGDFRAWSAEKGGGNGRSIATPSMRVEESLLAAGLRADQIDAALAGATQAGEERSAELLAAEEERNADLLAETVATANQDLLDNVDINTIAELREAVFADERFTARENEARYAMLRDLIADDPGRLRPDVSEGALAGTDAVIETTLAAAERANESNPRFALLADAERLAATETATVGQNVAERLRLGQDGENPGGLGGVLGFEAGFDVNQLDAMIEDAARRNNVTPEIAAAAMIRAFERDPLGRNTLERRFNQDAVDAAIDEIDQTDQRAFDERRANVDIMRQQMDAVRSQEQLLLAQIQQLPEGSPQRQSLEANLRDVRAELGRIEARLSNASS